MIDTSLDTIGGYHHDVALRKWRPGSCWEHEGQYLYRTVREMRPEVIVEVGRWDGCSASHLALACKHNGKGRVYSIDCDSGTGKLIPDDLRPFVEFINRDVFDFDWRAQVGLPIDILLEDGAHTTGFTEGVLRRMVLELKGGDGVADLSPVRVLCHDYKHFDCLKTVGEESRKVMGEPTEVFFEPPTDCGYGIWRRTPTR